MNSRERFLAFVVGGLVVLGGTYWAVNSFRGAVTSRRNTLQSRQDQRDRLHERRVTGEWSANQLGEYIARSLPADADLASRQYASWLLDAAERHKIAAVVVDPSGSTKAGDLYQQLSFRFTGRTELGRFVDFMHEFYERDRLHRIRTWSLQPSRQGDYQVEMMIDALSMSARPTDLPASEKPSYRIAADAQSYRDSILNRNLFEPPNAAPQFRGTPVLAATTGKSNSLPLTFEDPEKNRLRYELVDAPEDRELKIDADSGSLSVRGDDVDEFEITVRVTDDGYPRRTTEQTLVVKLSDPPPTPEPPPTPLKFDDAKQTVLTGLVQGGGQWEAWMRVRTRDQTLKLRVGDSFEVGSIKGTIDEVDPRSATFSVDGKRYKMKTTDKLREIVDAGPIVD